MFVTTLKDIKDISSLYAKNLALKLGLFESRLDYCKFIILGTARSGTTFLRSLLNSHSEVIAFGELFREDSDIGWDLPPYQKHLQNQRLKKLFQHDPSRFLEDAVFKGYSNQVSAVGFKIFYYQAQEYPQKAVWNFLKEDKSIKVIHLKRINMFKTFVSLKRAFETNRWCNTTGRDEDNVSISIDYNECLQHFIWTSKKQQEYDDLFQAHPKIEVFYETLCKNCGNEMKMIQDFLDIDYEPTRASIYKQSSRSSSEIVSNYFELKEQFKGTAWESFFDS